MRRQAFLDAGAAQRLALGSYGRYENQPDFGALCPVMEVVEAVRQKLLPRMGDSNSDELAVLKTELV